MSTSFGPLDEQGFNQPPLLGDIDLFALDQPLRDAVARAGADSASLHRFGETWGSAATLELGRQANAHAPRLHTVDPMGRRIDRVEFHPAYHELMRMSMADGLHGSVWDSAPEPAAVVARAARIYMASGVEAGHVCPITMTNAAVASLAAAPDLLATLKPKLASRRYDPRPLPWWEKHAMTLGMGMTERQGGTDVRANTSRATSAGDHVLILGHKWFMSAPMCDAFLVLAQASGGLSCFLMPRFLPDGTVNALRFQRLKDKLGNRSNASSEVEFHGAHAWLIGEEGRGVPSILEMVTGTRLDCAVASAGLMRATLAIAIHHCRHRTVFTKPLADQPLMQMVLADLALDVEAATALSFRLARSFDRASDEHAAAWRRLMTPVTKYWVCKIGPALAYEAMECLGGNGYVEDGLAARLYRELPLNAIWEGSGNVMALDLLRVLQREPESVEIVMDDLAAAVGGDAHLKAHLARVQGLLHEPRLLDKRGRELAEALAILAAGTILRAHAPTAVADAFIGTRLSGPGRQTYGQGLDWADTRAIVERAYPR